MRKKFFIKPGLQLRHLFWTLGIVGVSCILGYVVFETMVSTALLKGGLPFVEWTAIRTSLRLGFSVLLFILLGGIGLESYLLFHRFVGPIVALEKGLKKLAEGDWNYVIKIREYDQLSDLIHLFEDMKKEMKARFTAQENMTKLLTQELDQVLASGSTIEIVNLREKLLEMCKQVRKKAA